jgi:hypothetical protein
MRCRSVYGLYGQKCHSHTRQVLICRQIGNLKSHTDGFGVNQMDLWLIPVARFREGFPPPSCRYATKLDIWSLSRKLSFFGLLEETPEILPRHRTAYGGPVCGCAWASFHRTIPEPTRMRPGTNLLTQSQPRTIVARLAW